MRDGDLIVKQWHQLLLGRQIMQSTREMIDTDYWMMFLIWYFGGGKN